MTLSDAVQAALAAGLFTLTAAVLTQVGTSIVQKRLERQKEFAQRRMEERKEIVVQVGQVAESLSTILSEMFLISWLAKRGDVGEADIVSYMERTRELAPKIYQAQFYVRTLNSKLERGCAEISERIPKIDETISSSTLDYRSRKKSDLTDVACLYSELENLQLSTPRKLDRLVEETAGLSLPARENAIRNKYL